MDLLKSLYFFISLGLGLVFIPKLRSFLGQTSLVEKNYNGISIPNGMGLAFIFAQIITLGLMEIFFKGSFSKPYVYLFGFSFMGLLGFIDDTIGTDEYKGLRGHIGAFLRGKLTTGNMKALLGGFMSLVVASYFSNNFFNLVLNGAIIALFTNFMNLFDLRPGRACKVFIIISIILLFASKTKEQFMIIYSLLGILLPYMNLDLKAKSMMGDTGSNVLGYSLGFYTATSFSMETRIIILLGLIFFHVLAEKLSITKIIEKNKLLNFIDMLGR